MRAASVTWHQAIDQKPQTIGFAVILFVFTLGATAANEGSAKVIGQVHPYLIAVGVWAAAFAVVFLWNLWLAPYELIVDELAKVGRATSGPLSIPPASLPNPKPAFVDAQTMKLAGELQHLGEVVMAARFVNFEKYSTNEMYFRNIMESTHVIWTKERPRQLRRDFKNAIDRIRTANMEHDQAGRRDAVVDLTNAISALAKVLLGEDGGD